MSRPIRLVIQLRVQRGSEAERMLRDIERQGFAVHEVLRAMLEEEYIADGIASIEVENIIVDGLHA